MVPALQKCKVKYVKNDPCGARGAISARSVFIPFPFPSLRVAHWFQIIPAGPCPMRKNMGMQHSLLGLGPGPAMNLLNGFRYVSLSQASHQS